MKRASSILLGVFVLLGGIFVPDAHASRLIKVEEALKNIFPDGAEFKREALCLSASEVAHIEQKADVIFKDTHTSQVIRFTVQKDGQVIGYAFEDIVEGKWGPIHYVVGVTPGGAIAGLAVLDYEEVRGRPIAKKRFLKQYFGKTLNDPVRLRKDIDGVTGATISSRSFTDGVRKILHIFKEIPGTTVQTCNNP